MILLKILLPGILLTSIGLFLTLTFSVGLFADIGVGKFKNTFTYYILFILWICTLITGIWMIINSFSG